MFKDCFKDSLSWSVPSLTCFGIIQSKNREIVLEFAFNIFSNLHAMSVNTACSFFYCLPVRFDNLFVILTKHCRILVRLFYKIYLMCHRNISWGSYRVCLCSIYWYVCLCWCFFVAWGLSEVLCRLVGVTGWDLSTQPLSGTHTHSTGPTRP